MKLLGLWFLTATFVLSVSTLSLAQAPLATPIAAMPEKGEMKGEVKEGTKGEMKDKMKKSGGMMEKKSDTMTMQQSEGMEKKSEGRMEKKQP
jgi:hypothetical protein